MSTTSNGHGPGFDEEDDSNILKRPALARDLGQRAQPAVSEASDDSAPVPDAIAASNPPMSVQPQRGGLLDRWKNRGGVLGTIASILIFLLKIIGPALPFLAKLKFLLLAGGSMAISIWLESKVFGWPLAVGIVALIFIHECGHALAARMRGIPTGIMVFIPFMGAFVTTKRYGANLVEDAFIGIAGPIVGSIAAAACALGYLFDHSTFWLVLAQWGLFINLFNLLPTPPLDGGWIAPLFSPKLLAVGLIIAVVVGFQNPLIWLLLVFSAPRIIAGWRADPRTQPYYRVPTSAKWIFGVIYIGLAAVLAVGSSALSTMLGRHGI